LVGIAPLTVAYGRAVRVDAALAIADGRMLLPMPVPVPHLLNIGDRISLTLGGVPVL
jgi:hypothetical protein